MAHIKIIYIRLQNADNFLKASYRGHSLWDAFWYDI